MKKLGIMGGTFNPIHNGHLEIARIAAEEAGLDQVLFLPDGQPPHKPAPELASGAARFNMTALALWNRPGFQVSDMEIRRSGTTYTVDTLTELKREQPDADIRYIVGADTLFQVEKWSRSDQLRTLCRLIAVPRPGLARAALEAQARYVANTLGVEVLLARTSGPDISSTAVREAAARGESLSAFVPSGVADYISMHALYGAPWHPTAARLSQALSEHRFRHTLSVAETAVTLAARFGGNPFQAHLAGMLHDCAKGLDAPTLLRLIRSGGVSVDETERSLPALLHAPAGMALARLQYHVTDPAVLSAIRWHTTGRRNMTRLEKIVYLADMIEPERSDFPGLNDIRALALADLDAAVRLAAAHSVAYVSERGKKLHPRTVELARDNNEQKG